MTFPHGFRPACAGVGVLIAALSIASNLRADFAGPRGTWLSAGANVGAALHAGDAGFLLGAEASLSYWKGGTYAGIYLDGLHDVDEGRTRISVGPEFGYWVFGLDTGYLADVGQGRWRSGAVIRPFLSLAVVAPYARFGFRREEDGGAFQEFGVLLKWPFEASRLRSRPILEEGQRPARREPPAQPGARATRR